MYKHDFNFYVPYYVFISFCTFYTFYLFVVDEGVSLVSQHALLRASEARLTGALSKGGKMRGVATNVYLRKTSEKPERCGLRTLIVKGSRVVFTHGEGISTPHVRPKGRQPLIECANMTLIFYVPFYVSMSFIPFLYFLLFGVDKGVSSLPRIPQLR